MNEERLDMESLELVERWIKCGGRPNKRLVANLCREIRRCWRERDTLHTIISPVQTTDEEEQMKFLKECEWL